MALAWWPRSAPVEAIEPARASQPDASASVVPVPVDDGAKDVLDLLDIELKGMVRQLERAAAAVAGGAQSTATTLAEIRHRTDALTSRASGARTTAGTFSQAAENFTRSAGDIGNRVQDAARLADEAASATEQASQNVDRLQRSSSAIGNVVDLIAKIARQTAMLALNSTIEAARAGEAGRGFAVVASEVKALATQTQNAIDEIRQKVEALQQDAATSIAAVHRISDCITAIRPVFEAVNSAVAEQGKTTSEMVQNATATSGFIATVGDSAIEIDGATRGAEAHGTTVAEAGFAVKALVDKLKSRCAILLRKTSRAGQEIERLPCNLAVDIQAVTGAIKAGIHEVSRQGMLITGSSAAALRQRTVLDARIDRLGDCRIRITEQCPQGRKPSSLNPTRRCSKRSMMSCSRFMTRTAKQSPAPCRPARP